MLGEIAAIVAAVFFGVNHVLVRRGLLAGGTPFAGVYTSVLVNAIILWPLALVLTNLSSIAAEGLLFLVIAGLLAPTLARLMRFVAIEKLGVAGSEPLAASEPLFAAIFAILVRGENFTLPLGIGTLLIVFGVVVLWEGVWTISRVGVAVTLASAVTFGVAANFRKLGVESVGSPTLAAAVAVSVALSSYTGYSKAFRRSTRVSKGARRFFVGGGLATTVAIVLSFTALAFSDVVVAAPLYNTTPLFALVFTRVFLSSHEKINLRILLSAALVIAGAGLVVTR